MGAEDLLSLLKIKKPDRENFAFLDRLSSEERKLLSEAVVARLEEEGGSLYSTMAMVSGFIPNFLRVKIAQEMLGPMTVARMTSYIPVKQAIEVAKSLKLDFLVEVAIYQKPEQAVEVMENSPDSLLLNIAQQLIQKGHFEVLARFSDHLSPVKLRVLVEKLNNHDAIVQTAMLMTNHPHLLEITSSMPDHFLVSLLRAVADLNAWDLAARVGEKLNLDRQLNLLNHLEDSQAARIAAHYSPEIVSRLLDKVDTEKAVNIAMLMEPPVLGRMFNYLTTEEINRVLPYLSSEKILSALPEVNMKKVESSWPALAPAVASQLQQLAKNFDPLQNILKSLGL